MKEFDTWFTNFKNQDKEKNLWYVLMKPFMETAWKAALEWSIDRFCVMMQDYKNKLEKNNNEPTEDEIIQ